jgi:hypothetical protein
MGLAGSPFGNRKANTVIVVAAQSKRVQLCKAARDMKSDARWAVMMQKQDVKIKLEREQVGVKKRKDEFTFMTADTSNMDLRRRSGTWRSGPLSCNEGG